MQWLGIEGQQLWRESSVSFLVGSSARAKGFGIDQESQGAAEFDIYTESSK